MTPKIKSIFTIPKITIPLSLAWYH